MSSRDQAHDPAAQRSAALILDAFLDYDGRFADLTRRARRHFERRNWRGQQLDSAARIDLYGECIAETLDRLERLLDDRVRSRSLWTQIRAAYADRTAALVDRELAKTFFNTLTRRFFRIRGVDPSIEFVALDADPLAGQGDPRGLMRYALDQGVEAACARLLAETPFAARLRDPARAASAIARELIEQAWEDATPIQVLEFLQPMFYRERRAYRVGRTIDRDGQAAPIVIALVSDEQGVRVDAVLTNLTRISLLFGYARSSFLVDLDPVCDAVAFLHALRSGAGR